MLNKKVVSLSKKNKRFPDKNFNQNLRKKIEIHLLSSYSSFVSDCSKVFDILISNL